MRKTLIMKENNFKDNGESLPEPPIKTRILAFVDYKKSMGKFSVKAFEDSIGASNGFVKNIRKSISDDALEQIVKTYPEINPVWLRMGKGDMLNDEADMIISEISEEAKARPIPVYDIDVLAGKNSLVNTTDYEYIIGWARIPGFEDCIGAVRARGDSMFPVVKSNDQVLIMPAINKNLIDWGSMYVVVFGGEMPPAPKIKYIRKGPDKKTVILRSHNEKHEDMEVSLDEIKFIYPARAGVVAF
jgi:hypothetical protein